MGIVRYNQTYRDFGTYDLFHLGHEYHLKKAAKYGKLYVVVARDETVLERKGKNAINNEVERLKKLNKQKFIHKAVLGNLKDKYKIIEKIKPNIICLGYDQTHFTKNLKEELKKRRLNPRIIRFRKAHKPHIYKSSMLRNKLSNY